MTNLTGSSLGAGVSGEDRKAESQEGASLPTKLPECWIEIPYKKVISLQNGFAFKSSSYVEAGAFVIRIGNVQDGFVSLHNPAYIKLCDVEGSPFNLQSNDILISLTGNVGRVAVIKETQLPAVLNQRVARVIVEGLNPTYIYYSLKSKATLDKILKLSKGAAQLNISTKDILQINAALPPMAEQKVIADKLDTLLAQVETTKARLERIPQILKTFRQSVLAAAVSGKLTNSDISTWISHTVDDLAKVVNGKAFPSKDYQEKGVRLLKPGNLHMSGAVIWNAKNTTFIPESWKIKRPELILKEGALLMNLTAQSLADEFLGRVCVFSEQREVTLLNQRICSFESKSTYDIKPYLFLVFKSPQFRAYVDTLDSGTLIKHLNVKDIKSYIIQLPIEFEQTEIVRRVEELFAFADSIEEKANAALALVNNLTQSILAKAFRGELTEQWRKDNPELITGENSAEALLVKIKAEREALASKKKPKKKKAKG